MDDMLFVPLLALLGVVFRGNAAHARGVVVGDAASGIDLEVLRLSSFNLSIQLLSYRPVFSHFLLYESTSQSMHTGSKLQISAVHQSLCHGRILNAPPRTPRLHTRTSCTFDSCSKFFRRTFIECRKGP